MTDKKIAVVLMNLGGPDSLDAVEPFLFNLFSDKDIFKIPVAQKFFAKKIAKSRAPKVKEQYKKIGGKSPINEITENQREKLEKTLRAQNIDADVFVAMRYWKPFTNDTAEKINRGNYDKIILLPLYPHYSLVTIGSAFNEWDRVFNGAQKVSKINFYFDNEDYHNAINEKIDEAIESIGNKEVHLLFSAHSVPQSLIKKGDPYQEQILASVRLIMNSRNDKIPYAVSYQSKVGPVKWLEPTTENKIKELASDGVKNLVVVPISFVSDHLETLYELKIEYGEIAKSHGIENFIVTEGLNDSDKFINALKNLVINKLNDDE